MSPETEAILRAAIAEVLRDFKTFQDDEPLSRGFCRYAVWDTRGHSALRLSEFMTLEQAQWVRTSLQVDEILRLVKAAEQGA